MMNENLEELFDSNVVFIDALRHELEDYRHELEIMDTYDHGFGEYLTKHELRCATEYRKHQYDRRLEDKSTVLAVDLSSFSDATAGYGCPYTEPAYEIPSGKETLFVRMLNRLARRGVPIAIIEEQEKGIPFIESIPCERLVNMDRLNDIYPVRKNGPREDMTMSDEIDLDAEYDDAGGYPPIRPTWRNWPMFVSWRKNAEYVWYKPDGHEYVSDPWNSGDGDMNYRLGKDADDRLFEPSENLRDIVLPEFLWRSHTIFDWRELRINLNTIRAVVISLSPCMASSKQMAWLRKPLMSLVRFGKVRFEGGASRERLEEWFDDAYCLYPNEETDDAETDCARGETMSNGENPTILKKE